MENDMLIHSDLFFDNLDELLDFSKEEEAQMLSSAAETEMETVMVAPPAWNKDGENLLPCTHTTPMDIADASEDAFLCDDLDVAEMEWLSNFVEESFSPSGVNVSIATDNCVTVGSNSNSNGIGIGSSNDNNGFYHHPMSVESNQDDELLCLANSPLSVLENNGILINNNNNSSGMSSSTYSSLSSPTSSSCSAVVSELKPTERGRAPRTKRTRPLSFPHTTIDPVLPTSIDTHYSAEEPVQKKKKKLKIKTSQLPNALFTSAITNNEGGDVRKCLHCGIQKTPQWRLGPMGPKTLCNACGVRYKSGRLFPEYRPAASPTFLASVHSNSHKKVVEMRMTKTSTEEQEGAAAAAKQASSKCCELLNYLRGSKEWGAHEGRKDRGVAV